MANTDPKLYAISNTSGSCFDVTLNAEATHDIVCHDDARDGK